jgi:hypothetical protein
MVGNFYHLGMKEARRRAAELLNLFNGLLVGGVESAQAASFGWILPLTLASSAFVSVATMPGLLQAFAKADLCFTPSAGACSLLLFLGLLGGFEKVSQLDDHICGDVAVVRRAEHLCMPSYGHPITVLALDGHLSHGL